MQAVHGAAAFEVRVVQERSQAQSCFPLFKELRPHLDEGEFLRRWQAQCNEGYALIYLEHAGVVVAAAGYRLLTTMAWGKILYIDDLVTDSRERGRGFGSQLLSWIQRLAAESRCDAVHLDTGYQRHAAHRVYLKNGFRLECHHLAWNVEPR